MQLYREEEYHSYTLIYKDMWQTTGLLEYVGMSEAIFLHLLGNTAALPKINTYLPVTG